jgi:ribosomal protein L11 methyltransferase
MWRLAVDLPDVAAVDRVAAAIGEQCEAVSAFENTGGWRVEGLSHDKPNRALLEAALTLAALASSSVTLEKVPARDWLGANQAGFPPLRIGRFFIFGSHYRGTVPRAAIPILIDAATAFGTGEHPTTRGCLLAMDLVSRRPRSILDMGCGTGVLAIAAAKRWKRPVLACDIDREAVRVTSINARRNHVAGTVSAEIAAGYARRGVARRAPFDLVFANILARPLIAMAPNLARLLVPGGVAILSGLLARQAPSVLAAHRAQGLYLVSRIALEGWHTLVVAKRENR